MADVVWNTSTLPTNILLAGYVETGPRNIVVHQPEYGSPITRRRSTSDPEVINVTMSATDAQRAALRTFFRDSLGSGAASFSFADPITGTTEDFMMITPPRYTPIGGDRWHVAMTWHRLP